MSDLRSLIEAAKVDGPSAAARAKVWAGVSSAVAGGAGLGSATATGSIGASKMLILGTLLGGTVTVGIGAAILYVGGSHSAPTVAAAATVAGWTDPFAPGPRVDAVERDRRLPPVAPVAAPSTMSKVDETTLASPNTQWPSHERSRPANRAPGSLAASTARTRASGNEERRAAGPAPRHAAEDDALTHEASLLTEARSALVRCDPLSALRIVRGLRALSERQLVPEGLAVEAQALRALALDREADDVEAQLHAEYPDSALGR